MTRALRHQREIVSCSSDVGFEGWVVETDALVFGAVGHGLFRLVAREGGTVVILDFTVDEWVVLVVPTVEPVVIVHHSEFLPIAPTRVLV